MTKKATPPEVWDYASAVAFLAAGRNKEQRPLKDGWNTLLRRVDPDTVHITLHGNPVVTYTSSNHIIATPDTALTFVSVQRVQKYALGERYVAEKHRGEWQLFGESERLAHSLTGQEGIPFHGQALGRLPRHLELDDKRDIVTPLSSSWTTRDELRRWRKRADQWITEYMVKLLKGMPLPGTPCTSCQVMPSGYSLGYLLADPEHLFAHIIEGVYPPEVVMEAVQARRPGRRKELLPLVNGGSVMTVKEDETKEVSRLLTIYVQQMMRVW